MSNQVQDLTKDQRNIIVGAVGDAIVACGLERAGEGVDFANGPEGESYVEIHFRVGVDNEVHDIGCHVPMPPNENEILREVMTFLTNEFVPVVTPEALDEALSKTMMMLGTYAIRNRSKRAAAHAISKAIQPHLAELLAE